METIHKCVEEPIVAFGGRLDGNLDHDDDEDDYSNAFDTNNIFHNRTKLEEAINETLQNVTIGIFSFVHLSSVLSNGMEKLTEDELHIILQYLKSEMRLFVQKIHKLINTIKQAYVAIQIIDQIF